MPSENIWVMHMCNSCMVQAAVHHARSRHSISFNLVVLGSRLYGESWYDWEDVLDDLKRIDALEDSVKEVFL